MGTPPNAIVFASNQIRMADMVKAGFFVNLAAIILIILASLLLVPLVFGQ
jgi:sodium-dependent dicarboxylate transporter 2/3/5